MDERRQAVVDRMAKDPVLLDHRAHPADSDSIRALLPRLRCCAAWRATPAATPACVESQVRRVHDEKSRPVQRHTRIAAEQPQFAHEGGRGERARAAGLPGTGRALVLDGIPRRLPGGKATQAFPSAALTRPNSPGSSYGGSMKVRPRRSCGGSQALRRWKPSPRSTRTGASAVLRAAASRATDSSRLCASAPSSSISTARSWGRSASTARSGEPPYRCRCLKCARSAASAAA